MDVWISYRFQFNRSMRLKARKLGFSLNQRGLWEDVIRDPTDRQKKLHKGRTLWGPSRNYGSDAHPGRYNRSLEDGAGDLQDTRSASSLFITIRRANMRA
jgi:hypothetical protein